MTRSKDYEITVTAASIRAREKAAEKAAAEAAKKRKAERENPAKVVYVEPDQHQ